MCLCVEDISVITIYKPQLRLRVQEDEGITTLSQKDEFKMGFGFEFSSSADFGSSPNDPQNPCLASSSREIPRKGHEDERASHIFSPPPDSSYDSGVIIGIAYR